MATARPLIWVIDASVTTRTIVSIALSREGCEVVGYAEPVEALRAIKAGARPDVLFIEIELPTLSGYTVITYLRSALQLEHTAIIVLSRLGGLMPRLKARLAGANAFLAKPFTTKHLLDAVMEHSPH